MRVRNYILYLAVALTQVVNGLALSGSANIFQRIYHVAMPGKPLPGITLLFLYCTAWKTCLLLATIMAVIFLSLLIFLDSGNSSRKSYVPAAITTMLLFVWFQLLFALFAAVLPGLGIANGPWDLVPQLWP